MENKTLANNIIITRLTALWALNESGLGGMMFALHIPLTGFFVGGFAVVLISLIAFYSGNDFRRMIRAMLLVLIIKAVASPHAPPPAYLAVAFQGVTGAILFRNIRHHRLAALLLAILAMAESALQKIIVMTLIYGKSLWIALDKSIEAVRKDFALDTPVSYSYRIIAAYVLIHCLWGVLTGIFAGTLPRLVGMYTEPVLEHYRENKRLYPKVDPLSKRKRRRRPWLRFIVVLLFITGVFFLSGSFSGYKILYVVMRSLAAVLLLFFVLRPVLSCIIRHLLKRQRIATREEAMDIILMMPALRTYVKPSWQMARTHKGNIGRWRYFILSMIILSLYGT